MTQSEFDRIEERETEEFTRRCREYSARKSQAIDQEQPSSESAYNAMIRRIVMEVGL